MWSSILGKTDFLRAAACLSRQPGFVWLDSGPSEHPMACWSYLCADPVDTLIVPANAPDPQAACQAALETLKHWQAAVPAPSQTSSQAPFRGGAVGYFSYEFGMALLPVANTRHGAPRGALAEFGLYDTVIALNHATGDAHIYSAGLAGPDAQPDAQLAASKIAALEGKLSEGGQPSSTPLQELDWRADLSMAGYGKAFDRLIEHILDGDIYQANLAQVFTADLPARFDPLGYYRDLRLRNPAPFGGYGAFQTRTIACTSPERLVSMTADHHVEARPIKGTIRQSPNKAEDEKRIETLINSAKDRAENVMIVDLLRNDLSIVCTPGSVNVDQLCALETYTGLHHLTSVISGVLKPSLGPADLIRAVFPGGSITGAPKQRAIEIIDQLETRARGAFCGSLGYIGFDGALDFNIMIRTVEFTPGRANLHVGGGITLMSERQAEYDETLLKAERIRTPAKVAG